MEADAIARKHLGRYGEEHEGTLPENCLTCYRQKLELEKEGILPDYYKKIKEGK